MQNINSQTFTDEQLVQQIKSAYDQYSQYNTQNNTQD